jgi:hypothetical protein
MTQAAPAQISSNTKVELKALHIILQVYIEDLQQVQTTHIG